MPPALHVHHRLARALVDYLYDAGQDERGGVLLGYREDGCIRVGGAVFPPQLVRHRISCAFDVSSIDVIRGALSGTAFPEIKRELGEIVGWIHSHPRHGLFLSRTDIDTLGSWTQLDERAVAVVVDPFLKGAIRDRIAWWGKDLIGQQIELDKSAPSLTIIQTAQFAQCIVESAAETSKWWDFVTSSCVIKASS